MQAMESLNLSRQVQSNMVQSLEDAGLLFMGGDTESSSSSSDSLLLIAREFQDRPEVFSTLLQSDFGVPPLIAHQTRAAAMAALSIDRTSNEEEEDSNRLSAEKRHEVEESLQKRAVVPRMETFDDDDSLKEEMKMDTDSDNLPSKTETKKTKTKKLSYSQVIVSPKASQRAKDKKNKEYGLPSDCYEQRYPTLASELEQYYKFMTQPSPYSQEDPIRAQTANVYMRHAKQFLGWYLKMKQKQNDKYDDDDPSIFSIIPNKDKDSATILIDFILWLRAERDVSVSYEANLLRGLVKLLKFRFAKESSSSQDDNPGGTTFTDIPIIKEIRKVHRDANQRAKLAPRASDEQQKWISWPEFLKVVEWTQTELLTKMKAFQELPPSKRRYGKNDKDYCLDQIQIAEWYQKYLILAIFSQIPDRQRTLRELELGRTFFKDQNTGCYVIKHGPDDYKTGKAYGERPPMQLPAELTESIDDFLEHWRPALRPSTNFVLVQSKTGKPMTGDSIYARVSRTCFNYTGKRTNPHLLRDMIVTHVRESDHASEKQLEALALYMGHSIQMQRTSYDRRTLTKKIAPAVELMQTINNQSKEPGNE